jgi:S-adenosylmethionine:diacylglycerol 3-amino-3-carboxypropyl transferase
VPALGCAQDWHDTAVLIDALQVNGQDDVFAVGSGADGAFALALAGAGSITVSHDGPAALALFEIKRLGGSLHYLEHLQLLGVQGPGRRVYLYHRVRGRLSPQSRGFWDAHEPLIRAGIVGSGRAEHGMAQVRRRLLPLAHDQAVVRGWFDLPDVAAQGDYFRQTWDTWRWQGVLSAVGWTATLRPGRHAMLREDVHRVLTTLPIRHNGYLQWLLLGEWIQPAALPVYLSAEGHRGLAGAEILSVPGPVEAALAATRSRRYSVFYLSDHVPGGRTSVLRAVARAARPGARLAWWSWDPRTGADARALGLVALDVTHLRARDRVCLGQRLFLYQTR